MANRDKPLAATVPKTLEQADQDLLSVGVYGKRTRPTRLRSHFALLKGRP